MADYIATFFTHYDAVRFSRGLQQAGIAAALAPVPRRLSSSCGTCARFAFGGDPLALSREGLEQLVREEGGCYLPVIDNR